MKKPYGSSLLQKLPKIYTYVKGTGWNYHVFHYLFLQTFYMNTLEGSKVLWKLHVLHYSLLPFIPVGKGKVTAGSPLCTSTLCNNFITYESKAFQSKAMKNLKFQRRLSKLASNWFNSGRSLLCGVSFQYLW